MAIYKKMHLKSNKRLAQANYTNGNEIKEFT